MDSDRPQNSEESSPEFAEPQRVREITRLRGHTMKEYEEQLSQLKKENFKLKLRIYFLEEGSSRKSAFNEKVNPEALIQYEELKNEAELTRNELNEKQSLLFDAMLALDAMEEKLAEEQRQRQAQVAVLEDRIMLLDKELETSQAQVQAQSRSPLALSECGCSSSPSASKCNSHERLLHGAQSPISPRALVTVAAHVRDLQEQVGSLEVAVRDETATSNRLREQLKMEKEIRSRQDEEIALRFQNSEDQAATILQLTIDRERLRERCADLQESLAKSDKLRFKLEVELRDREERLEEVEAELERERMRLAEADKMADKMADIRCIPCMTLESSQHTLGSKNSLKYELSVANDAASELSRLRIDYNLALQNMARFLRRSRMQQAALERAERREQQLLEEIRELRATCSAAKLDLSCIKDQLSPSLRQSRLTSSSEDILYPDSGDYTHVPQRSRSEIARSAPSLLSWVLQSLSQMSSSFFPGYDGIQRGTGRWQSE